MPPYRLPPEGCRVHGTGGYYRDESWLREDEALPLPSPLLSKPTFPCSNRCAPDVHVHRACAGVRFIAKHTRLQEDATKVRKAQMMWELRGWVEWMSLCN